MITLRTGDLHDRPIAERGDHGDRPYIIWPRLLRIDLKRGGGAWILPLVALIAVFIARRSLTPGVAVWPEITGVIATLAQPVIILAVGIGALAGGRERRSAVEELAGGTAMDAWQRYLSLAASVFLWALGTYALAATVLLAYGALRATWGGPEWGVIVVPIPVFALGAAFGVLVGRIVRDRTAPIIAIALFLLLLAMPFTPNEATRPLNVLALNAWFDPIVENATGRPFSAVVQLAWSVGLTGVVVGIGILWERRTALSSLFTVASITLAAAGATGILASGYVQPTYMQSPSSRLDMASPAGRICDDAGAIVICVHPAYERMLSGVASDANRYLAPMAGLNGVVDEVYISSGNGQSGGWDQEAGRAFTSLDLAFENDVDALITRELWPMAFFMAQTDGGNGTDTVQFVVMTALARDIGVDDWPEHFHRVPANADDPGVRDAIDRFAALASDEQRSWIEANWDELSNGRLTLEELP